MLLLLASTFAHSVESPGPTLSRAPVRSLPGHTRARPLPPGQQLMNMSLFNAAPPPNATATFHFPPTADAARSLLHVSRSYQGPLSKSHSRSPGTTHPMARSTPTFPHSHPHSQRRGLARTHPRPSTAPSSDGGALGPPFLHTLAHTPPRYSRRVPDAHTLHTRKRREEERRTRELEEQPIPVLLRAMVYGLLCAVRVCAVCAVFSVRTPYS